MNTEKRTVPRMLVFVGAIFLTALTLGGLYLFISTPGSPDSETLQRPQNATLEQNSR